jgi:hypothetical protein
MKWWIVALLALLCGCSESREKTEEPRYETTVPIYVASTG